MHLEFVDINNPQNSIVYNKEQSKRNLRLFFMATEPKLDSMPEEWTPYCPSALQPEDISLWSCGTTTFDFTGVEDVYAKDEKVLENMW